MASRVAVVRTRPQTVLQDAARAMELGGLRAALLPERDTLIKLNLSWTKFFPACSSWPWQLDGAVRALLGAGHVRERLLPVENKTVVTDPVRGCRENLWEPVIARHGLRFRSLVDEEWAEHDTRGETPVLSRMFHGRVVVPRMFAGRQVLHLPTLKTHGHTVTTGAIKNSFGGLLREDRHHAHKHIHEVLAELLVLQQQLHPAQFSLVDGTVAGDGAGPRTMRPREMNVLLAGADPVAVDAVGAALMGFDPLQIRYLQLAHERGLGCANLKSIELLGDAWEPARPAFHASRSLVIFGDQLLRRGPLRFLEPLLLHGPLFAWAPAASNLWHDGIWYPTVGRSRIARFRRTTWGALREQYRDGTPP